jgi:endonuclease/exonuclease/phosphatase (EEP) superfamily protein YafD
VDTDQAPLLDDYMAQIGFANPIAPLGNTEEKYGIQSRLDAIFISGMQPTNAGIERDITLSDHWPVWTDVRIQP